MRLKDHCCAASLLCRTALIFQVSPIAPPAGALLLANSNTHTKLIGRQARE